jgi:hypothetical protein
MADRHIWVVRFGEYLVVSFTTRDRALAWCQDPGNRPVGEKPTMTELTLRD